MKKSLFFLVIVLMASFGFSQKYKKLNNQTLPNTTNVGLPANIYYLSEYGAISDAKIGVNAGFFTFAIMCLIAIIFFYRYVPEIKGKNLEEIEKYWECKSEWETKNI